MNISELALVLTAFALNLTRVCSAGIKNMRAFNTGETVVYSFFIVV